MCSMSEKTYNVTLIEGDGIGPEVAAAAVRVLEAAGACIEWDRQEIGVAAREQYGVLLPGQALASIQKNGVALKGPVTTPSAEGYPSLNVTVRKSLDLYACLRPVKSLPGARSLYQDVDLVVVRENTEDLYAGLELEVVPGVVQSVKVITRAASTRIARFAFEYAKAHGRKLVTAVHKANIMKLSDGLFLNCCRGVAKEYPQIEYTEMIVDAACHHLVLKPGRFDVLVMENLYGDIISDLAAGLVGGLGLVPGANLGENCAVFEATHGSWPEGAGKGLANPTAFILTSAMMMRHLGEDMIADRIESAIGDTYLDGGTLTSDQGGSASTTEFTDQVMRCLSGVPA